MFNSFRGTDVMGYYDKKKMKSSNKSSNDKSPICVGPWPSRSSTTRQEGDPWDDGFHTTVKQLVIVHGAGIDSIKFEYHDDSSGGTSVWSQKHGGSGGFKTDKIKLDYPGEYLKSISGYYGSINDWSPVFIRSLTLESNRKKYGPFGNQQGTQFSFPATSTASKIVGFHGHSSWYLTAIGVYLKPVVEDQQSQHTRPSKALMSSQQTSQNFVSDFGTHDHPKGYSVVQGCSGSVQDNFSSSTASAPTSDGKSKVMMPTYVQKRSSSFEGVVSHGPWGGNGGTIFDDEVYTGVRQVNLTRSTALVSIEILYDRNGQPIWGSKNGGAGGRKLEKYGPFGNEQGTAFSSYVQDGMIIGFHGRGGWFIDSIGVHVLKGKVSTTRRSLNVLFNANTPASIPNDEVIIIKEPVPHGPGPWGGDGGKPWDDGAYTGIKQIHLTKKEAIFSIQIQYEREGRTVWSARHGGSGRGASTTKIKFQYPDEWLTCVTGYYGGIVGDETVEVIKSLTFYTSKGKYGPYGEETGTYFSSSVSEGKVVGFHGRSSSYLDAIGVHMQNWLGNNKKTSKSIFSKIFK
ncbi:hypothetical protein MKW94_024386 [Papaver nudicaule]|uniref:Jacalin-type lectin domain-containing protein n=1 Tax=Papaver nudicaule TaxID=74823 RepID=A0AA41V1U6_PAPNU|nr:hypothetical protein [Papaver nudicaule]